MTLIADILEFARLDSGRVQLSEGHARELGDLTAIKDAFAAELQDRGAAEALSSRS